MLSRTRSALTSSFALLFLAVFAASTLLIGCESDPTAPSDDGPPADTTAPTVSTVTPTDGATGVAITNTIRVVFSEDMDSDSLAGATVTLTGPSGSVASSVDLSDDTLTITPDVDLMNATEYTVEVGAELTDVAGNELAAPLQSAFTTEAVAPPVPEAVRFVGRFDATDPAEVRFSWPGSGLVVRFDGTGARVRMRGGQQFTVIVDGVVQPDALVVSDIESEYELASGLTEGEHTIELYKRTEPFFGTTVVTGVEVDGTVLDVPAPSRTMEVVGDSWSTGHGVDGGGRDCPNTAATQNHFRSWGALAARTLDAELSTVAYGGIGVVRDGRNDRTSQMLTRYALANPDDAGGAGTIRPVDAVLVSLGANDFIDGRLPTDFADGYTLLLEQIRARHPDALIGCVWPRLDSPSETELLRTAIEVAIAARDTAGDTNILLADLELPSLIDFGCEFHPGPLTHQAMADLTVALLRAQLGWS